MSRTGARRLAPCGLEARQGSEVPSAGWEVLLEWDCNAPGDRKQLWAGRSTSPPSPSAALCSLSATLLAEPNRDAAADAGSSFLSALPQHHRVM